MLIAPEDQKAATDAERRTATRHPAAAMPAITGVRLSPVGSGAQLVNISTTGVLVRCSSRLMPGTAVTVLFEGTFAPPPVKATVVRCLVADIGRGAGLSYHVGIAFKTTIDIGEEPAPSAAAAAVAPAPVEEAEPARPQILVNRW